MKFRSLFLGVLAALMISAGFTSCSDDDDDDVNTDKYFNGEKLENYAFVLNEGADSKNNASLAAVNWMNYQPISSDIYVAQNKQALGDVAQDMIADGKGNVYVVVFGSAYVAKLNAEGVEQTRADFTTGNLKQFGQPRYAVLEDGMLYITTYGAYVVVLNANDLAFVKAYQVGKNPEHIVESEDKIYNTNSGWGEDNTVTCYNTKTGKVEKTYTVMSNPDGILEVEDRIFVQGYGAGWDYPWGEINLTTGEFTQIGNASSWAEDGDVIYTINSVTDWDTYTTVNYFTAYDVKKSKLTEGNYLVNMPEELNSASVFSMQFNPRNGFLYIATSDYKTDGTIYVFDNNKKFVTKFSSMGINPKKFVFFK